MAKNQLDSPQFKDGGVKRADLNTATVGSAVIAKVIAGAEFGLTSTGADTGTGDVTITIAPGGVTLAMLANVATASFIGRNTAGTGVPEVLPVATAKTMLGLSGTNTGDQTITLTGDVTGTGTGSFAATIASGAVTFAKFQNITTNRLLGRSTAGTGSVEEISIGSGLSLSAGTLTSTGSGGTVTSVDVSGLNGIGVSGNPITTTGTIVLSLGAITPTSVAATGNVLGTTLSASNAGTGSLNIITLLEPSLANSNAVRLALGKGVAGSDSALLAYRPNATALDTVFELGHFGLNPSILLFQSRGVGIGAVTNPGANNLSVQGTIIGSNLSGTNTGDQTITLTGDVTGTGTGSFAATIAASAVTLTKMANVATASVFYRKTAGSGAPEVNTLATLKTDLGLTGTNSGDQTITLTGDVTGSGIGSFAATIANSAVTYAKIQNVTATNRLLGRSTAGAGIIEELIVGTGLSLSAGTLTASGSGGTVTDFSAGDLSPLFTTTEATTTTTPALSFTLSTAAANTFFGNGTGSTAVPTFMSASTARTALGLVIGTNIQAWDADLDSWAAITRASGFDTFVATPSSANLAALVTGETGTGALVFAASPTLSGVPLSTTAAVDTNTTQIATTAFVLGQAASATPLVTSGAGAVGTSTRYARADHVHPIGPQWSEIAVTGAQDASNKTFTLASAVTGVNMLFLNGQLMQTGIDYSFPDTTHITFSADIAAPLSTNRIQMFAYA